MNKILEWLKSVFLQNIRYFIGIALALAVIVFPLPVVIYDILAIRIFFILTALLIFSILLPSDELIIFRYLVWVFFIIIFFNLIFKIASTRLLFNLNSFLDIKITRYLNTAIAKTIIIVVYTIFFALMLFEYFLIRRNDPAINGRYFLCTGPFKLMNLDEKYALGLITFEKCEKRRKQIFLKGHIIGKLHSACVFTNLIYKIIVIEFFIFISLGIYHNIVNDKNLLLTIQFYLRLFISESFMFLIFLILMSTTSSILLNKKSIIEI